MFVTNPQIILIIEIFILPTDWNIFSSEMPSIIITLNKNALFEYSSPILIMLSLSVYIIKKRLIPKRHTTISIIP